MAVDRVVCNLTVRQVIDKLNTRLRGVYERPIVKKQGYLRYGESIYDKSAGRYVITMYTLMTWVQELLGGSYHITTERWDVYMYGSVFRLKAKRKKLDSDIDTMTIVGVELVNTDILDMSIHEIYTMARNQHAQNQAVADKEDIVFKQVIEQELKKYNMPLSVFMVMQQNVEKANHSKRRKLGLDR